MAVLLVVLGTLGASPTLHAALHGAHDHESHDHEIPRDNDAGCVVLLFAQGLTSPAPSPEIEAPAERHATTTVALPDSATPVAPPHLQPPGRGPPVNR